MKLVTIEKRQHAYGTLFFQGQLGSVSSSESQQQIFANLPICGISCQRKPVNAGSQGAFSLCRSRSVPVEFYAVQRENVFPERPGEPDWQLYMKTGDCMFGAACRFHHPKERLIPALASALSPFGLPLRPGSPLCVSYSSYGFCMLGRTCKFDHPIGIFPSTDAPVPHLLGLSSGTAALTLSSEGLAEARLAKPRRLPLSETRQMPSGDDNIDTEE